MNKLNSSVFFIIITFAFGLSNSFSQSKNLFFILKDDSMSKETGRVGFIDDEGRVKIPFKFYYAGEFNEGLCAVILTKGEKWGYVDKTGNVVIEPQFDEATSFSNGLAKVNKQGKTFFINRDGKQAFESELTLLGFKEDLSPARLLGSWGFVDKSGKIAIPFKFQNVNPFYENLAAVIQNNLIGYIDKSGDWVIPPRYSPMLGYSDSLILPNFSEGFAVYRDGDKYGFINNNGKIKIPASFDRVERFSEGLALVKLNERIGYLNNDGQYVIEPRFDNGQSFSNNLASVKIGEKWGFIDKVGKVRIIPKYDSTESFKNGLAKVSEYIEKDGKTIISYINKSGKVVYSWNQ